MTMEVKLIPGWSLITILLLNIMIISTNGFNFKRSITSNLGSSSSSLRNQGKSSSSSDGHFGKSDKHGDESNDGSSRWSTSGKQFNMDSNDDSSSSSSPHHLHSDSGKNGRQAAKGDLLSDQEFQQARVID